MTAAILVIGSIIFVASLLFISTADKSSVDMTQYTDEEIDAYTQYLKDYYESRRVQSIDEFTHHDNH